MTRRPSTNDLAALRAGRRPDWPGLMANLRREITPSRAFVFELLMDPEVEQAICERFGLDTDVDRADPDYPRWRHLAVRRFCGFDFVRAGLTGQEWTFNRSEVADSAGALARETRGYQDEHVGPITNWQQFETYPWPDPEAPGATADLEWWSEHLPEDMCLFASGGVGHFAEYLMWLMGYETLCYALFDQRDLVEAIAARLEAYDQASLDRALAFERVEAVLASDDMGFKTGLLLAPDDMRRLVVPGHRKLAARAHEAGKLYLLHSCGNLGDIYEDLIEDVKLDGKHSFEDTIEDVRELKATLGRRVALLGGIDVDFLCRADEEGIRRRVRQTLDICSPGGGFCIGTGNTVANYIPLENYLVLLDEAMRWGQQAGSGWRCPSVSLEENPEGS
jgi:uroporphyrinogen decarboxylase